MAPYHVTKQLAECLVISELDYASVVFDPLPAYQLRCLQRVQNACARFVLRKYANESVLVTLNWLDIAKRRKVSVLKFSFKSWMIQIFLNTFDLVLKQSLHTAWDPLLLHYCVSPKNVAPFSTLPQLFSTVSQRMSETLRCMDSFANQ